MSTAGTSLTARKPDSRLASEVNLDHNQIGNFSVQSVVSALTSGSGETAADALLHLWPAGKDAKPRYALLARPEVEEALVHASKNLKDDMDHQPAIAMLGLLAAQLPSFALRLAQFAAKVSTDTAPGDLQRACNALHVLTASGSTYPRPSATVVLQSKGEERSVTLDGEAQNRTAVKLILIKLLSEMGVSTKGAERCDSANTATPSCVVAAASLALEAYANERTEFPIRNHP